MKDIIKPYLIVIIGLVVMVFLLALGWFTFLFVEYKLAVEGMGNLLLVR